MAQDGNISVPVHVADTLLEAIQNGYKNPATRAAVDRGYTKVDSNALLPTVQPSAAMQATAVPSGAAPVLPAIQSPLDRQIAGMTEQVGRDEAPPGPHWGQPGSAHPGTMGKILHTLGRIGDVAGTIVAPGAMMAIPGTTMNKDVRSIGDFRRLQGLEQLRSQQGEEALHGAQTKAFLQPKQENPVTIQTDEGVLQYDPSNGNWSPIQVNGETAMPYSKPTAQSHYQHVAGTSGGKQVFANYNPTTGEFTDQSGKVLSDFKPSDKSMQGAFGQYAPVRLITSLLNMAYNDNPDLLPIVAPLAAHIMAQYGDNPSEVQPIVGAPPPGQPEDEQGHPIGRMMPGAPTSSTRSRGQFAAEVLPTMKEAAKEIDQLRDQLGPFAGRYSDLAVGKIGAYGPQFSGLQTDIKNIASGWGRLHGNSEKVIKEFLDDLDSSKDPEDLKEKLKHYAAQAKIYKRGGEGKTVEGETRTYQGHTYKKGDDGQWHLQQK